MQIKLFAKNDEAIPFPMDWDCSGWHSTHPIHAALLKETDAKLVVELGTWKAASAVNFAQNKPDCRVITCDHFLGGADHLLSDLPQDKIQTVAGFPTMYYQALYNIRRSNLSDRIAIIPNTTHCAAQIIKRAIETEMIQAPDLIYVDAGHEERSVAGDVEDFWPLLRAGGVMYGDDYGFSGVSRAVNIFVGKLGTRQPELIDGNFWILRKA